MHRQTPLVQAAHEIRMVSERGGSQGFAGLEIIGDRLELRWKGTVPADVAAVMGQTRQPITILPAAYSRAELKATAQHITAAMSTARTATTFKVSEQDGGLLVETDDVTAARTAVAGLATGPRVTIK